MGSALVIADANFSAYAKGRVNILKPVPVTGMTINGESSGKIGDIIHLSVTFTPNNTIFRNVEWSVNDPAKASISEKGDLLLLESGDVVVTASSESFQVEATKEISIISEGVLKVETNVKCISGYIDYKTGGAVNNSELCHPTTLDITPFAKFETELYNSSNPNTSAGYAIFAADRTYISGEKGTAGDNQNKALAIVSSSLPDGAAFLNTTIKGVTNDMLPFSGLLKSSLGLTSFVECREGLTSGYIISGVTGNKVKVSGVFVTASDYVAIPLGKKKCVIPIFVDTSAARNIGCAFYDSEKGFISGKVFTSSVLGMKFEEIEIPSNAQYVSATFHEYGFTFIMF